MNTSLLLFLKLEVAVIPVKAGVQDRMLLDMSAIYGSSYILPKLKSDRSKHISTITSYIKNNQSAQFCTQIHKLLHIGLGLEG